MRKSSIQSVAGFSRSKQRILACAAGLILLSASSPVYGASLGLEVLDAQFTSGFGSTGYAFASGTVGEFFLTIDAYAPAPDASWGNISGSWVFRPTKGPLTVNFFVRYIYNYYPYEQDLRATIQDLTTGAVLLDLHRSEFDNAGPGNNYGPYDMNLNLDHLYEFTLSGFISAYEFKDVDLRITANFSTVPDNGSSLWLTAFALACVLPASRSLRVRRLAYANSSVAKR